MKYLRKFEESNITKMFWMIPTDDRLHDSLDKIQSECGYKPPHRYYYDTTYRYEPFIFLGVDLESKDNDSTSDDPCWEYDDWNSFEDGKKIFIEDGYKFMGLVNMEEFEIYMIKYNV